MGIDPSSFDKTLLALVQGNGEVAVETVVIGSGVTVATGEKKKEPPKGPGKKK